MCVCHVLLKSYLLTYLKHCNANAKILKFCPGWKCCPCKVLPGRPPSRALLSRRHRLHIKSSSEHNHLFTHCWRFGLHQRPSSEDEAGTSSSGFWHDTNVNNARIITLRASCSVVYCNRSCLWVYGCVCVFVGLLPR